MKKIALIIAAVIGLAGCGETDLTPRAIQAETDVCAVCNMSITYEEFAGQLIEQDGDHFVFDDLGCLIEHINGMDQTELGAAFIKDAVTDEWLNIERAAYVYAKDEWTPMAYHVLAFEDEQAAEEWLDSGREGELLTLEDLYGFDWGNHH
ncbi:nitrous oxide reductase accessory protein NosL [Planococcus sp. ISL-109]|uniref:nitrous oxide reductase accessory protein NosL n=1 Tax=Planococcus sp. ISL-109 TaxID=2819166 RepID=UPI001BE67F68|nr:nitrous oxide reductase accessory protein NosL [Planococcus sp. ISL-109]MBT2583262.1 nitrous oxide reductase accessory protein NosL [Planococcus sp. ISL-109]